MVLRRAQACDLAVAGASTLHRTLGRCVALLVVALTLFAPSTARGEGVLSEPWSTVRTDHFVVHGHEGVRPLLLEIAELCEQAHEVLAPVFGYTPRWRTHVVVTDATDGANGSASVIPFNTIRLNAVAPRADGSLGHYDHWMWNLIVHEYTHILHLGRIGGVPRALNIINDAGVSPNQTVPRWFTEGLAVWAESEFSGTGRTQSALFAMYLRAAAQEGRLPRLGQLSGSGLDWPFATSWYLYGGFAIEALIDEVGLEALRDFLVRYGRQLIGYRLNALAEDELGVRIDRAWEAWRARAAAAAIADGVVAHAKGTSAYEPRSDGALGSRHVRAREDRVAWLDAPGTRAPEIVVWNASEEREELRVDAENIDVFDWLADDRLVVSASNVVNRYRSYRDLFALDLRTGARERLTYGERAWLPSATPDGARIYYVRAAGGRTALWRLDADGTRRAIHEPGPWGQVGRPAALPEGGVVAPVHEVGGGWELGYWDAAGTFVAWLTEDGATALDPAPDGRGGVVFASDRSGRFELYRLPLPMPPPPENSQPENPHLDPQHPDRPGPAAEPTSRDGVAPQLERITHTHTGYFSPAVSQAPGAPASLFAARYSAEGFSIVELPDAVLARDDAPPPALDPPRPLGVLALPETNAHIGALRTYPSIRRLRRPRWSIDGGFTGTEGLFGATLSGRDEASVNSYTLVANWSLDHEAPFGAFRFANRRLPVGIALSGSRSFVERNETLVSNSAFVPFVEDRYRLSGSISVPFPAPRGFYRFAVSYGIGRDTFLRKVERAFDAQDIEPREPEFLRTNALSSTWSWSAIDRFAYSFSSERGAALSATLRVRAPELGADVESADLSVTGRTFVPLGQAQRFVLALRGAGGFGQSNGIGRRIYRIGGIAPHDAIIALSESAPVGAAAIRGYKPGIRAGDRFAQANLELRMRVASVDAGASVLPFWLGRLSAAAFADAGQAGTQRLNWTKALLGLGAELRLDGMLGYYDTASLRAGIARGLGREGITSFYVLYGFPF